MLIDFHTHIFPDALAPKAVEHLRAGIRAQSGIDARPIHDATLSGLQQSMARSNVDLSMAMPIATGTSESINDFAAGLTGNVRSFGSVHPMQADWEAALERVVQRGLIGIKLHPEFQGCFIDSPECLRVLRKAEELGLYVTVHAGRDVGKAPPVKCTPDRLLHVLEHIRGDRLIAAHMGGYGLWDEVEQKLAGTPLWFDTALTADKLPREQYLRIIRKHGARKILFGSDSPWEDPADTLRWLRSIGLTADELALIEHGNAERILA